MTKDSKLKDIRCRANLCLQMLLQFNVYLTSAWALVHGFHLFYNLHTLFNFHGTLLLCGYALALLIESCRLYAGYSGNLRCRAGDLSTFITMSLLMQLPILVFLLLSAQQAQSVILVALIATILVAMALEIVIALYAARQLTRHEDELCKLKCAIYQQQQQRSINAQ